MRKWQDAHFFDLRPWTSILSHMANLEAVLAEPSPDATLAERLLALDSSLDDIAAMTEVFPIPNSTYCDRLAIIQRERSLSFRTLGLEYVEASIKQWRFEECLSTLKQLSGARTQELGTARVAEAHRTHTRVVQAIRKGALRQIKIDRDFEVLPNDNRAAQLRSSIARLRRKRRLHVLLAVLFVIVAIVVLNYIVATS